MQFTADELRAIRTAMEEEHRLNIAALERVMKFAAKTAPQNAPVPSDSLPADQTRTYTPSLLECVRRIFADNPSRTFSPRLIEAELISRGIPLLAKQPIVTIGVILKKLHDRDVISLIRKGSGKEPNMYQLAKGPIATTSTDQSEYLD